LYVRNCIYCEKLVHRKTKRSQLKEI